MSISGGVDKAPERGRNVNCNIIQIFTKNSNQWNEPKLSQEIIQNFKLEMKRCNLKLAFAHDSYLINLGSPDKKIYAMSLKSFLGEHHRSEKLGLMGVVFHPGAHVGSGEEAGLRPVNWKVFQLN